MVSGDAASYMLKIIRHYKRYQKALNDKYKAAAKNRRKSRR
jgi:hypothetical protein